jgi:hypothetical protein
MSNEYTIVRVRNPFSTPNGNHETALVAIEQNDSLDDLYPTKIEQVFHLAKQLNLPETNDTLEDKVRKVNKAIINLFKRERKFFEKSDYTFDELKSITEKNKIKLDLHTFLKSIIRCPIVNYCFQEVFDNNRNRKYRLTNYISNL